MLRIYGNPFAAFYWFDDDVMAILNRMVFAALRPPKSAT
jgi:hypothetical protein